MNSEDFYNKPLQMHSIDDVIREFEDVVSRQGGVIGNTLYPRQVVTCRNILKAFKQGRRFVFVEAPTGSGKSIIALAIACSFKRAQLRSMLTVPTRELQRQLIKDVAHSSDVRVMMGMGNFPCLQLRDEARGMEVGERKTGVITASESPCHDRKGDFPIDFGYQPHDMESAYADMKALLPPPHAYQLDAPFGIMADDAVLSPDVKRAGKVRNIAMKKACKDAEACPYYFSRDEAERSAITVMSLHGYIGYNHLYTFTGLFTPRDFQSFDECHRMDGIVRDFYKFARKQSDIDDIYEGLAEEGTSLSMRDMKTDHNEGWTDANLHAVAVRLYALTEKAVDGIVVQYGCSSWDDFMSKVKSGAFDLEKDERTKKVLQDRVNLKLALENINKKKREYVLSMTTVKTKSGRKWVTEDALQILPVAIPEDAQKFYGTYNLFMTATMLPFDIMKKMYRVTDELGYYEKVPDSFPVESRPIFKDYVEKMTESRYREVGAEILKNRQSEFGSDSDYIKACRDAGYKQVLLVMSQKLREIANHFKGKSGLIFVNGYTMAKDLGVLLSDDSRFVAATTTEENIKAIRDHKERVDDKKVSWLISAGTKEGYDFKDGHCRVQVFAKIPFPPMDRFMTAVNTLYRGYYAGSVVQTIRQQYGRGMRGAKDFCATIVLDSMFDKVINDPTYSRSLPTEFLKAIQKDKKWQDASIDSEKISY